jgi:hypothetical protein
MVVELVGLVHSACIECCTGTGLGTGITENRVIIIQTKFNICTDRRRPNYQDPRQPFGLVIFDPPSGSR